MNWMVLVDTLLTIAGMVLGDALFTIAGVTSLTQILVYSFNFLQVLSVADY